MKDKMYNIKTELEGKTIKMVTAKNDENESFYQIELIFTDDTLVKICDGGMDGNRNSLMYSGLYSYSSPNVKHIRR
jgi:hypothetical protein